jgi:DNA polymerase-3 subunit beta
MKLLCTREALLQALERCSAATENTNVFPYSQSVKLTATGDQLQLTATNSMLLVDTAIVAKSDKPGVAVVPCANLMALVRALPGSAGVQMALSPDGTKLLVKSSNRKYTLATRDPAEYPAVPEPEPDKASSVSVNAAQLKRLVGRVKHAVDPGRLMLDLVRLVMEGSSLTAMAMNGHRFAVATEPLAGDFKRSELLLPTKFVNSIAMLLDGGDAPENITLIQDDRRIYVETEDTLMMASLPVEKFTAWDEYHTAALADLVPVCKLSAAALMGAVRAVTALRGASDALVTIAMNAEDKSLSVAVKTDDSEAQDKVAVEPLGDARVGGAQANYLLDALRSCEGDVTLSMNTALHFAAEGFEGIVMQRSQ